jgi:hypothetical protein
LTRAPRKDVIGKYLEGYAEPERQLGAALERTTQHVLVIPACDESASLLDGLRPAFDALAGEQQRALCIVVVNATDAHDSELHARNAACFDGLKAAALATPVTRFGGVPCWYGEAEHFDLLLVDRHSDGQRLPTRQGVGLARKIGCDIALSAIRAGRCEASLIHMSDADVRLPHDYFAVSPSADAAALIYPFFHEPCDEPSVDEAHLRYEAYLRYYVLGLRHAGSAYDFHTIGSCIAVTPSAYAAVRGVPKRQAGEDFYLLNKIAKIGPVDRAPTSRIAIRARTSSRVPFGTGRATHDIARDIDGYRIYDPHIFDLLGAWLTGLATLEHAPADTAYQAVHERAMSSLAAADRNFLQAALRALDARTAVTQAAAHSPLAEVRRKRTGDWFDAFRTLKLVHALRHAGLVSVPWRQAMATAGFCHPADTMGREPDDGETVCRRLARLEQPSGQNGDPGMATPEWRPQSGDPRVATKALK